MPPTSAARSWKRARSGNPHRAGGLPAGAGLSVGRAPDGLRPESGALNGRRRSAGSDGATPAPAPGPAPRPPPARPRAQARVLPAGARTSSQRSHRPASSDSDGICRRQHGQAGLAVGCKRGSASRARHVARARRKQSQQYLSRQRAGLGPPAARREAVLALASAGDASHPRQAARGSAAPGRRDGPCFSAQRTLCDPDPGH